MSVAMCALVALGVAGAMALASGSATRLKATAASSVDPMVAGQLAVFNRPATSADALPTSFAGQLQATYASVSPATAESRKVTADAGQAAYLVPASGGVCVINSNESFCAPAASLAGAATADLCSPTLPIGQLEIEWLLPDGATNVSLGMADGTSTRFASVYNAYIARLPLNGSLPKTIQWQDPSGQQHSVSTPIPSDAQSQSCEHPPN